mgnify:CR=1 FL=1
MSYHPSLSSYFEAMRDKAQNLDDKIRLDDRAREASELETLRAQASELETLRSELYELRAEVDELTDRNDALLKENNDMRELL